jgi:hypothetical protein
MSNRAFDLCTYISHGQDSCVIHLVYTIIAYEETTLTTKSSESESAIVKCTPLFIGDGALTFSEFVGRD